MSVFTLFNDDDYGDDEPDSPWRYLPRTKWNNAAFRHRLELTGLFVTGVALVAIGRVPMTPFWMHLSVEAGVALLLFWAIEIALKYLEGRYGRIFLVAASLLGLLTLSVAYVVKEMVGHKGRVGHEEHQIGEWYEVTMIAVGVSIFIAVGLEHKIKKRLRRLHEEAEEIRTENEEINRKLSQIGMWPGGFTSDND